LIFSFNFMLPVSELISPAIIFNNVVLPDPLFPTTPRTVDFSIFRSMPENILFPLNDFERLLAFIKINK